jgi:trimeric autotransporter adhesin
LSGHAFEKLFTGKDRFAGDEAMNITVSKQLLAAALAISMAACGGGGGGSPGGGNGGGGGSPPPPPPTFTISGTVTGLTGTVVLRNNGSDELTLSANSAFTFNTAVASGGAYNVTVRTHPSHPAQDCVITNGSGAASANITNVTVACSALPTAEVLADAGVRSAKLNWASPSGASSFNVYVSSARNCDIRNYSTCADGALVTNVTSPHTIPELRNGQAYFFQLETVYANGARGLSNLAGGRADEAAARPNVLAFNGDISAIAPGANGVTYVGGTFTRVGILTGSAAPLNATSGRLARPDFPIVAGIVNAIAPDGSGGWYLGGSFTRVGDQPRKNLAHILADGTVDLDFNKDANAAVRALAVSGTTVYVGGDFGSIGNDTRNRLAAINGVTGEVTPWNPGANGTVRALAVSGSAVYAGGDFSLIGGGGAGVVARSRLAAINGATGAVMTWNPGAFDSSTGGSGAVQALAVSGNTIYAGGDFKLVGTAVRRNLAAITVSGTVLDNWKPSVETVGDNGGSIVYALAVSGSTVYAGGYFTRIDGETRRYLAAIGADGRLRDNWRPNPDGVVHALAVSGGTVYVAGTFGQIGGKTRNRLAAIGADSTVLNWAPSPNGEVQALAVSGSTVYAGGEFNGMDSEIRAHLAAIGADGSLLDWAPRANNHVEALAVLGNTVYAGGAFSVIDSSQRFGLAAIGIDGTVRDWNLDVDRPVRALAASGDTVYVGGQFTQVGGKTRNTLAAIGANGAILEWNPGTNGHVLALAVGGGVIYVGGVFTRVGSPSVASTHLAAINANGTVVQDWMPNLSYANGSVAAVGVLALSPSHVYVGGAFNQAGGQSRNGFAAFDRELASTPLPWNPSVNGGVATLAVSGSTIYLGGQFTHVSGEPRNNLAAIEARIGSRHGSMGIQVFCSTGIRAWTGRCMRSRSRVGSCRWAGASRSWADCRGPGSAR